MSTVRIPARNSEAPVPEAETKTAVAPRGNWRVTPVASDGPRFVMTAVSVSGLASTLFAWGEGRGKPRSGEGRTGTRAVAELSDVSGSNASPTTDPASTRPGGGEATRGRTTIDTVSV